MTATSHTDWFVRCDAENCTEQLGTDDINAGTVGHGGTAAEVRRVLRQRGWAVSVLAADGGRRRMDFCPAHNPTRAPRRADERTA